MLFLQSWNEVRESIKKDDPIPVILFMFSLFFVNVPEWALQVRAYCVLVRIVTAPGAYIDQRKF